MTPVRFHPETDPSGSPEERARLNLLLTYGGWQRESWCDRLPLLLEPMGVRSYRVGSGREASDLIRRQPIHIAVVDLALPLCEETAEASPEEGGHRILELLRRLDQPPPTVVVKRTRSHRDDSREINAALRAGAFAIVDRPLDLRGLETMLEVLRRCLYRFYQNRWPGFLGGPAPQ
ncbi:MAG: response regulator [Phycisphaeraceae bacterium]|nr:response regulator [Phycisphaeraceae bacterium]